MSVMRTRISYGAVLVTVVTALFWADRHLWLGIPSAVVLSLLALAAQAEFLQMGRAAGYRSSLPLGLGLGAAWLLGTATQSLPEGALSGVLIVLLLVGVLGRQPKGAIDRLGVTLVGFLAIPYLLSHLLELRALPDGWGWLIFVVAVAKTGDSCAFFAGSTMGKHKLIPEVSPNKSWEGAIASVLGGVLAGGICAATVFEQTLAWQLWLPAAIVTNIGAQFGDLSESLLKRSFGSKDSAGLVPAFGGTFDMVDSFLLAAPVLHLYLIWFA